MPPPRARSLADPTAASQSRNVSTSSKTNSLLPSSSSSYTSLSRTLSKAKSNRDALAAAGSILNLVDKSGSERVLKRVSKARRSVSLDGNPPSSLLFFQGAVKRWKGGSILANAS